jgi:hypothetical protein
VLNASIAENPLLVQIMMKVETKVVESKSVIVPLVP